MGARSRNTILVAAAAAALVAAGMPAAAQEKVQIDFWQRQFEDYQQEWFGSQVDAFNASQDGIEVVYEFVAGDAWDAKIKAAQAANVMPDVIDHQLQPHQAGCRAGTVHQARRPDARPRRSRTSSPGSRTS